MSYQTGSGSGSAGNGGSDTMTDSFGEGSGSENDGRYEPSMKRNVILRRHIEAGDISQADLDIIQHASRLTVIASTLGTFAGGIGANYAMKKRRPQSTMLARTGPIVMIAGLGSFAGYVVGLFGAALEVKTKLPDAEGKMRLLRKIAEESAEMRRQQMEQRGGGQFPARPPPPGDLRLPGQPSFNQQQNRIPTSFPAGTTGSQPTSGNRPTRTGDTWENASGPSADPYYTSTGTGGLGGSGYGRAEDREDQRERSGELDRQRSYDSEMRQIRRDSEMSHSQSALDRDPLPSSSQAQAQSRSPAGLNRQSSGDQQAGDGAGGQKMSTWDQIRMRKNQAVGMGNTGEQAPGSETDQMVGEGTSGDDAERREAQRKFDEMLERERSGVGETETWK